MAELTLVQTCSAMPEQYDAFDANGDKVGYLRFRFGGFTVVCPDVGGELVYSWESGDRWQGELLPKEHIINALDAISDWMEADNG
ncbi:MAG: hypothetical protein JRC93_03990 [Deltaproteobacteria bacterium]|nr:hypothetical protein [Deltaproteobacteria bacterium]